MPFSWLNYDDICRFCDDFFDFERAKFLSLPVPELTLNLETLTAFSLILHGFDMGYSTLADHSLTEEFLLHLDTSNETIGSIADELLFGDGNDAINWGRLLSYFALFRAALRTMLASGVGIEILDDLRSFMIHYTWTKVRQGLEEHDALFVEPYDQPHPTEE